MDFIINIIESFVAIFIVLLIFGFIAFVVSGEFGKELEKVRKKKELEKQEEEEKQKWAWADEEIDLIGAYKNINEEHIKADEEMNKLAEFKKEYQEEVKEEKFVLTEYDKQYLAKKKKQKEIYSKYKFKKLFSKSEYHFMKKLLDYTKERDFEVLSKVRLADIVDIKNGVDFGERRGLFNRIKSKHIDFVILDTSLRVKCLIELDGWNHYTDAQTKENDRFKNELCETLGLNLVRFKVGQIDFEQLNKYLA